LGLVLVIVALFIAVPARADDCLNYEAPTQLHGVLKQIDSYGPPGCGEDPEHDQKNKDLVLILKSPICINQNPNDPNEPLLKDLTEVIISSGVKTPDSFDKKEMGMASINLPNQGVLASVQGNLYATTQQCAVSEATIIMTSLHIEGKNAEP
jgi:hypothetical protein